MTIVCEISAKDLLSQLNFFFRSNWIPSKNSINIHFSLYFYSIQAAGIGLRGFAKEIAGDLLKSKLTSFKHSSDAVAKKNPHTYKEWLTNFFSSIFQNYFWQTYEICHGTSLGILIKIQEEPIRMTMCGPSFGHKSAMFWPFLVKGAIG